MANNSPTNLAKGGEKAKEPITMEESMKQKEQGSEPELDADSTEPVVDASAQPAADLHLEQARGTTFGDNTSSNGDANTRGLHGRDGGSVPEGPSNPAPSPAAIEPTPVEASDPVADAENKDGGQ